MRGREQLKVLLRMDERVMGHKRRDMSQFRRFSAQKFAPGGSIEKQILNRDGGACGQGGVFDAENLAPGNFNARACGSIGFASL